MIGGEDLYTRYAEKVYRYLFALCGRADTAEEPIQETFCRALAGQKEFRGECAPSTWLCAIAKRVWYQELARGSRTAPLEEAALAGAEEPPEQAEQRLERLELYRALQKLAPDTREVIYLRLAGEFSFREIGEILGRSEVWARVRFYRGKEELTRIMGGDGR